MFTAFKKSAVAASLVVAMAVGVVSTVMPTTVFAYDEASTSVINVDQSQVILKGHDAVAYFSQKAAVKGDKKFSLSHEGATYLFASAANMKAFQANPAHYAPQFGGYCAMGAALGKKLDVDPTQFVVHNDKLYLNVNADVFAMFSKDIPGNVAKGDSNWPTIKNKAANTL